MACFVAASLDLSSIKTTQFFKDTPRNNLAAMRPISLAPLLAALATMQSVSAAPLPYHSTGLERRSDSIWSSVRWIGAPERLLSRSWFTWITDTPAESPAEVPTSRRTVDDDGFAFGWE